MDYKKVLELLGLIEGVDFALTETSFDMLPKIRQVSTGEFIHHDAIPAVYEDVEISPAIEATYDEEQNELTPAIPAVIENRLVSHEMAAWDEEIFEDETYTPDAPSQEVLDLAWEDVQLKSVDMADLVNAYLADKTQLKDIANDCVNIVEGLIYSWSYTNIPQPTKAQLLALIPIVNAAKLTRQAIESTAAVGAQIRQVCNTCYNVIVGFNVNRGLTFEQVTALSVAFADIQEDLQNLRPWSAKPKIQAVTVDGTLITQSMKDMVLSLLTQF